MAQQVRAWPCAAAAMACCLCVGKFASVLILLSNALRPFLGHSWNLALSRRTKLPGGCRAQRMATGSFGPCGRRRPSRHRACSRSRRRRAGPALHRKASFWQPAAPRHDVPRPFPEQQSSSLFETMRLAGLQHWRLQHMRMAVWHLQQGVGRMLTFISSEFRSTVPDARDRSDQRLQ